MSELFFNYLLFSLFTSLWLMALIVAAKYIIGAGRKMTDFDDVDSYWSEVLGEYFNSKRTGALAITGEWGSGKTHLFKNTIRKIIEGGGRKCLYVSLYSYGISGKGLDDFLIEELSGIKDVDDKSKSGAGALLTGLFTSITSDPKSAGVIGAAVMAVGGAVKKRIIDALEGYVLCFDDLDRLSESNFLKAWSEINYFSEFKSRKVIMLLDETKILQGSVHAAIYEKNIWRDVPIRMSCSDALKLSVEIVCADLAEELSAIVETHLMPVVSFFDIKNVRTISTSLELLRRIHLYKVSIGSEEVVNSHFLKILYQVVFLASLTSKLRGKKTAEQRATLSSICNGYYDRQLYIAMQDRNSVILSDEDVFIQSLPSLICNGSSRNSFVLDYILFDKLEVDDLKRSLVVSEGYADYSNRPICKLYERLLARTEMSEVEYLAYFNEVIDAIQKPAPGICDIKNLATIIYEFSYDASMGGTPVSLDQLLGIFKESIVKWRELLGIDGYTFEVAGDEFYVRQGTSCSAELDELLTEFDTAIRKYESEKDFIQRLSGWSNDKELKVLRELAGGFDMPLFKYIEIEELKSFLSLASGATLLKFNSIIRRRFSIGGSVLVILEERDVLLKLKLMFEGGTGFGFRRVQFSEGCQVVDAALKHIDSFQR